MANNRQTSQPTRVLDRDDIERIYLQASLDNAQRWQIYPELLTPAARGFLQEIAAGLKGLLSAGKEAAND